MKVTFPGGKKVNALYEGFTIKTDQPVSSGGNGDDVSPVDLFFASISTCVGYYVLIFCQTRDISTEQIEVSIDMKKSSETGLIEKMVFDIQLPADFPEKYRKAVTKAADQCKVKIHLENPPSFEINATVGNPISLAS